MSRECKRRESKRKEPGSSEVIKDNLAKSLHYGLKLYEINANISFSTSSGVRKQMNEHSGVRKQSKQCRANK